MSSVPLTQAVTSGDAGAVKAVLANGADVNERTGGGQTPLILATIFGHTHLIPLLLDAGADPQVRDNLGLNAIDWAHRRGATEVIDVLSNKPSQPSITSTTTRPQTPPARSSTLINSNAEKSSAISEEERSRRWIAGLKQRIAEQSQREVPDGPNIFRPNAAAPLLESLPLFSSTQREPQPEIPAEPSTPQPELPATPLEPQPEIPAPPPDPQRDLPTEPLPPEPESPVATSEVQLPAQPRRPLTESPVAPSELQSPAQPIQPQQESPTATSELQSPAQPRRPLTESPVATSELQSPAQPIQPQPESATARSELRSPFQPRQPQQESPTATSELQSLAQPRRPQLESPVATSELHSPAQPRQPEAESATTKKSELRSPVQPKQPQQESPAATSKLESRQSRPQPEWPVATFDLSLTQAKSEVAGTAPQVPAQEPARRSARKRCPKCNAVYNSDLVAYCAHHIVALVNDDEIPPVITQPQTTSPVLFWTIIIITLAGSLMVGSILAAFLYSPKEVQPETTTASPPTPRPVQKGTPVVSKDLEGKVLSLPIAECPLNGQEAIPGTVVVRVAINRTGQVTEAKASGGDWLLRGAASEAAMKSTFAPDKLRRRTTAGTITYTFEP